MDCLEFMLGLLQSAPQRRILFYDFEFIAAAGDTGKRREFTTEAHITQVNFTMWDPDAGFLTMVADWTDEAKPVAIAILQTDNIKVSYNGDHADERVAEYNGFDVRGSQKHDAMNMVHFLFPDLPARRQTDDEEFLSGDDGALMPSK